MIGYVINRATATKVQINAGQRNSSKPSSASRRKSEVFSDVELDTLGAWGEWAGCDFCGGVYDWEIRRDGDNGVDFIADEVAYAVKYNHRANGYLVFEERDGDTAEQLVDLKSSVDVVISTTGLCVKDRCRCASLMKGDGPILVVMSGWLLREEFMAIKRYNDWGLGGRYWVPADELHDIREIPALNGKVWAR